jgi:hypothetical protein
VARKKLTPKQKSDDLRVGDRVRFTIGLTTFHALVIVDRGNLGFGGRQIVGIEIVPASELDGEIRRFEMPAERLLRESLAA